MRMIAPLAKFALLAACWAFAATAHAADCSVASQRDATCVGSLSAQGHRPTPAATPSLLTTLAEPANSCVSVPFVAWAYDPVSYRTREPTFIAQAGSGYLGSGGRSSPTEPCSSDSDGSCSAWVPASHPYLLRGSGNFDQCAGARSQGSIACSVSGGQAYVTTNPAALTNFSAHMIACKTNQSTPGMKVMGAPFGAWQNCALSASCSFFLVYPADDETPRPTRR